MRIRSTGKMFRKSTIVYALIHLAFTRYKGPASDELLEKASTDDLTDDDVIGLYENIAPVRYACLCLNRDCCLRLMHSRLQGLANGLTTKTKV